MSKITDFYTEQGVDSNDMYIQDVLHMDDAWWEGCHNHIQWVFPLMEPSKFNPDAPLLTQEDIDLLRNDCLAQSGAVQAFRRFLRFLGLEWDWSEIIPAADFFKKADVWTYPNHNWLRVTRVLKFLKLVGLEREANIFYNRLTDISNLFNIPAETDKFWFDAVNGNEGIVNVSK